MTLLRPPILRALIKPAVTRRLFATLPQLMNFPPIVVPKLSNSLRNWFFVNFVIRPYMDKDFTVEDFSKGANQAICIVSHKLAQGKYDELESDGLVSPDAISELKKTVPQLSVSQLNYLPINEEDIVFSFLYQIGIILPDEPPIEREGDKPAQIRHVEITVVAQIMRDYKAKLEENKDAFSFIKYASGQAGINDMVICNYRFFRNFTAGATDPSWTINLVNHFLVSDMNQ